MRRSALALLLGTLVLTTVRLVDPAPTAAGHQREATLVVAVRTHGTATAPPVGLLSVAALLAALLVWRSVVPATPSAADTSPQLPIRRRGPPALQS